MIRLKASCLATCTFGGKSLAGSTTRCLHNCSQLWQRRSRRPLLTRLQCSLWMLTRCISHHRCSGQHRGLGSGSSSYQRLAHTFSKCWTRTFLLASRCIFGTVCTAACLVASMRIWTQRPCCKNLGGQYVLSLTGTTGVQPFEGTDSGQTPSRSSLCWMRSSGMSFQPCRKRCHLMRPSRQFSHGALTFPSICYCGLRE